jgi:Ca2+-binding RTX toxin-like protein
MRFIVGVLIVAATAVAAPAASANYTLSVNASAIVIGPGGEPTVSVSYSLFCFFGCPTTQPVGSVNGAAFTNGSPGNCTDTSGGASTDFSCSRRLTVQVTGTASADSVTGTCFLGASSLTFTGLGGDDTVSAAGCGSGNVELGDGNDSATASGTVNGGAGNDSIRGGGGVDTLDGGEGRDTVDGRANNDTVRGGGGRDLLIGGPDNDVLEGGADTDTASYEDHTAPVNVTLDNLANDGQTGETDRVASDVENLIGGSGDDTLTGDAGANDIDGGEGGDVIDPGAGPDFVDGGAGNDRISARDGAQDRIQCGDGNDLAVIDAFDTVIGCEDVQSSRALMPDVDEDGVPAPADCDDANPSRRPGFTDKPGNAIDEDCSGADAPYLRIFSPVQFLVTTSSSRTTFSRLRVQAVPEGATIEVRCTGGTRRGCFSGVKRFSLPKGAELRDIRSAVRGRRFQAGARVEVRILDADSIGKVFRFTMNAGKKTPTTSSLCLVPGQNAPGRCPRT